MNSELQTWRAVWFQAVARAWKDAAFKAELVTDARAALTTHFNYDIPQDAEIRVVEAAQSGPTLGTTELVLPDKPDDVDDEAVTLAALARQLADTSTTCIC